MREGGKTDKVVCRAKGVAGLICANSQVIKQKGMKNAEGVGVISRYGEA